MGHLQESLQIITAILLQELPNVLTMFGRLPMLQKRSKAAIADWPVVHIPGAFIKFRFVKLVPAADEIQHRGVLIH